VWCAPNWRAAGQSGPSAAFFGERQYPAALMDLPDAPPCCGLQGAPICWRGRWWRLVGARNASSLGIRMARGWPRGWVRRASPWCRAWPAASTEAHMAALATGTVAVQAGGVDVIYPEENAGLAEEIRRSGLRLSEQPIGLRRRPGISRCATG
jgi:DNA processing protein